MNGLAEYSLVKLAGQQWRVSPDGSLWGPGGIRKEDWEKGERPIMNPGKGIKKTPGPGNKLYVQPVDGKPEGPAPKVPVPGAPASEGIPKGLPPKAPSPPEKYPIPKHYSPGGGGKARPSPMDWGKGRGNNWLQEQQKNWVPLKHKEA